MRVQLGRPGNEILDADFYNQVFTYPAGLGFETWNLISTVGAFVLAAGIAVVV